MGRKADGTILGVDESAAVDLGGGGYVTSVNQSKADAIGGYCIAIGLDTYGFLMLRPKDNGYWQQCVTVARMAAPTINGIGRGGWCFAFAPSNTNYAYGVTDGQIWKTTNQGDTFTRVSSLAPQSAGANVGGPIRYLNSKIAIDDQNPLVAIICFAGTSGAYGTTDGFNSYTKLAGIANPPDVNGNPYPLLVSVDPTSAVVGSPGVRQRWAIGSNGTGVYISTNGPLGTYTLANSAGMPTSIRSVYFDNWGDLWVVTSSGVAGEQLKKYSGGVWSSPVPTDPTYYAGEFFYVSVNPFERGQICLASDGGGFLFTIPDGEGGWKWNLQTVASTYPIPVWDYRPEEDGPKWFTYPGEAIFCGDMEFDNINDGCLLVPHGLGILRTDPLPSTFVNLNFTDITKGIEQLCGTVGLYTNEGAAMLCFMDKVGVRYTDFRKYPMPEQFIRHQDHGFGHTYAIDKAADGTIITSGHPNGGVGFLSRSIDDGRTFTGLPNHPNGLAPSCSVAVQDANTYMIVPGANQRAIYTDDNCATGWKYLDLAGTLPGQDEESGWDFSLAWFRKCIVWASKNTPGTWWIYNYGPTGNSAPQGLWKSTTGPGGPWTKVKAGCLHTNGIGGTTGQWAYSMKMKEVPGMPGTLLFATGWEQNVPLCISTDGGLNTNPLTTTVNGVAGKSLIDPMGFDFGKPAEGNTVPVIRLNCTVDGVGGVYETSDFFANTRLVAEFPTGTFDDLYEIVGNPYKYGEWCYSFGGSGWGFSNQRHRLTAT